MAHRRSNAVIDSTILLGEDDVPLPSCPSPVLSSSSTLPMRPPSAFKSRKKRGLSLNVPADDFSFTYYDDDSTKYGDPLNLDESDTCSSMREDALVLMRNMSITPRSNSNGSNGSQSNTSTKPKSPEPSIPLFLVPSWETPAILKNEYRIVGILGK